MLKRLHLLLALIGLCVPTLALAQSPAGLAGVFYDDAYVAGAATAKVTVTEYASIVCPHCAHFDADVFPAFKKKYIDTGKVKFVFREFLTEPSDLAASGFILARCAGKTHYFDMVEAVFRAQPEMFSGQAGSDPVSVLQRVARTYGVDDARFHACLADTAAIDALNKRMDHADLIDHVSMTPTLLVNGRPVATPRTGMDIQTLSEAVDSALAGKSR